MALLTLGTLAIAAKIGGSLGAGGIAAWFGTRQFCSAPEVSLSNDEYERAATFEWAGATEWDEPTEPTPAELDASLVPRPDREAAARLTRIKRHWVAEVRVEFPARLNRPSDRAAMSKWLAARLREKGWRVAHIADFVPRVVALACNQSYAEIVAAEEASAAVVRTAGARFFHRLRHRWTSRTGVLPDRVGC